MIRWLRLRQEARPLAQADAEALIRDHGAEAYREARERERDVIQRNQRHAICSRLDADPAGLCR